MQVWVVTEEKQLGHYADGSVFWIISIHHTEEGADDARDAWRRQHAGTERPHRFVGDQDDDWCRRCDCGATVSEELMVSP